MAYFYEAKKALAALCGTISRQSSVYKTAAWGNTDQNDFLNQALLLETDLSAKTVLSQTLSIEKKLGRSRENKWAARTIDIDIIFYNNDIIVEKNLHVPHPHMQDRKFVLLPLSEIAPNYLHPQFNKTVTELLLECKDDLYVEKIRPNNFTQ